PRIPEPLPEAKDNLAKAQACLESRTGGGGTEMMKAIKASMDPSDAQGHVRIVVFMTDGYVGNDMEIIGEVQKHPNARVFAFGIGNSVNRFLLDNMAKYGRGEVEYVGLNDDGSAAARRFHERVRNPLATDITIDWNGMPVADEIDVPQPSHRHSSQRIRLRRVRTSPCCRAGSDLRCCQSQRQTPARSDVSALHR